MQFPLGHSRRGEYQENVHVHLYERLQKIRAAWRVQLLAMAAPAAPPVLPAPTPAARIENQSAGRYTILTGEYRLPPTANLLRLLVQQSNCFVVVERSAAGMNAMSRERALQQSGEMRQGGNFGKGQMVSSDYGQSPETCSARTTGGMAGSLGGLFGASAGASVSGYNNTPQGKVISAAFMDAFNNMVASLRNYKAQAMRGQGLGGGCLTVDGAAAPQQTSAPAAGSSSTVSRRKKQQQQP